MKALKKIEKKDILKLLSIFKPSLAKALSVPLLVAGIGILNSPLWLDFVNWFLSNQEFYPRFNSPISPPKESTGWIFIGISISIFVVDSLRIFKTNTNEKTQNILDIIKEQPQETANFLAENMKSQSSSATHIIDEKISKRICELQHLRFFGTFLKEEKSIQLANDLIEGELARGSSPKRALGLALSSRYLSVGENIDKAKVYLEQSKKLTHVPESKIAEAFIITAESGINDGLSILAGDDNSSSYSAIFMIKRRKEGTKVAINWFDCAELTISHLDVDGQISYLSGLLESQSWDRALSEVEKLEIEKHCTSPALAQIVAFTFLTNAIKATELRDSVIQQIPFAAETFPLADDIESIKLRNKAVTMFKLCSVLAKDLKAYEVVEISEKYALWLELRNPDTFNVAEKILEKVFFEYTAKALEYLPLAFAFRIELDYERIEQEIDKQSALSNNTNPTLGVARFVLAHKQKGYAKTLKYIDTHREQLEKFVNPIAVKMLDIEVHAKAGLAEDAEKLLNEVDGKLLGTGEFINLKSIIATTKGEDPIALELAQYNETGKVSDLAQLVNLLKRSELKEPFLKHAIELFDITGAEPDAINVANAYTSTGKFSELHLFLECNMGLVDRSVLLQMHWAWSLFRKGNLIDSRNLLIAIRDAKIDYLDLDTLDIHLNIFSGNWDALTSLVEARWENKEQLDEVGLMQTAQLAKAQSPSRAKEILVYATNRFPNDPQVLSSAYFTATTMGWEDSKNTADWLNKAAILSNDEGPLHTASFKDMKDMMYAQREQNDRVQKAYDDSAAPIFTVAELLHRTLSDFYLVQPLENIKTTDIRKKSLIAAFHSVREEKVIESDHISIDASSVLVLGYLDLLDLLFEYFNQIAVPHSLMRWLYEEKQKVAFHQPSQIAKAKEFENLVSDECINIITPRGIENPELGLRVGDDLAFLLEEAKSNGTIEEQTLVVCSYPVFQVGSFRDNEVDLSQYNDHLISCVPLINKLKDLAVITEEEFEKSKKYLIRQEKEWPHEIEIADKANIYLDSLSVTYLMTVGMLERFKCTGLKLFVHVNEHNRYKKLRNFDSTIHSADLILEKIRNKFSEGITSGQVILSEMLAPSLRRDRGSKEEVMPTEELFQVSANTESVLIDDRFINQNANIEIDGVSKSTYTTLDFIETLYSQEIITFVQKVAYRTKLRESGYGVIPVCAEELSFHLNKSLVKGGELRPTKELKLIKQHLSLLKISRLIKLPRDANWLHCTLKTLSDVLKKQWANDVSIEVSRARSNWIYELIDFRSWSHCLEKRSEAGMAFFGETIKINSLLVVANDISTESKNRYHEWLDEHVLMQLKNYDTVSFNTLIATIKGQIKNVSKKDLLEEQIHEQD